MLGCAAITMQRIRKTLLITGCGGPAAQNAVSSLRLTGDHYRIVGADCDPFKLPLVPGFDRKYLVPRADHDDYVPIVNRIIAAENVDLIHNLPDPEILAVSEKREKLDAQVFLPEHDALLRCYDKFAIKDILHQVGVGTARCIVVNERGDMQRALEEMGPKVWIRAIHGAAGRGALPVEDLDLACMWIDFHGGWGSFMAEEFLPGRNLAWQAVYFHGELVGSIASERLQYVLPNAAPSGITGTASVLRIIDDDIVHEVGARAIAALDPNPHGAYGVDLKENAAAIPYITEINPGRFFQPSFLYAKAGYPLMLKYFELAFGIRDGIDIPVRARVPDGLYWIRGVDTLPVLCRVDKWPALGEPFE